MTLKLGARGQVLTMGSDEMAADRTNAGHRQRLRERFMACHDASITDVALLELLLTYAIPRRDVQPIVEALLNRFGDLRGVLMAPESQLSAVPGISTNTTTLLKVVDRIRRHFADPTLPDDGAAKRDPVQTALFRTSPDDMPADAGAKETRHPVRAVSSRRGTGLFSNAILKEAVALLPRLPDTDSLDEARDYLKANLHYSASQTRDRFANYIIRRMFSRGVVDRAMRAFAASFAGRQEFREACFFRFIKAEPLMVDVANEVLLPAVGTGQLSRAELRAYLAQRFPAERNTANGAQAIVEALVAGGIAKTDRKTISFAYREVLLPSFAFVDFSEFPDPGMYDLGKLEENRVIRAMLWRPDQLVPALYELRNRGLVAKVSEIDSVRQFTTNLTLTQAVDRVVRGEES